MKTSQSTILTDSASKLWHSLKPKCHRKYFLSEILHQVQVFLTEQIFSAIPAIFEQEGGQFYRLMYIHRIIQFPNPG